MDKPRVVLADDHPRVLDEVRRLLKTRFEVIGTAKDGAALVEMAQALEPDLVVTDISMPSMTGIEAARRLKATCPTVRIVFLSIHRDPELIEEALSTGAFAYVPKVRADQELIPALQAALEGKSYKSAFLDV